MTPLGSLDHLVLRAADVDALTQAYVEAMGAVVVEDALPERARLRIADVDVVVERGEPAAGVVATFRIPDAEGFRASLGTGSFELEGVEDRRGSLVIGFRDPAGNRLQAVRWGGRIEDLVAP